MIKGHRTVTLTITMYSFRHCSRNGAFYSAYSVPYPLTSPICMHESIIKSRLLKISCRNGDASKQASQKVYYVCSNYVCSSQRRFSDPVITVTPSDLTTTSFEDWLPVLLYPSSPPPLSTSSSPGRLTPGIHTYNVRTHARTHGWQALRSKAKQSKAK